MSPTVFAPNSKGERVVVAAGHVQFQTTPEEREAHGLAAAYGHSPKPGAPRTYLPMGGQLNDGRRFTLTGVETAAKPYGEDIPLDRHGAGGITVDHGPISAERAARLRDLGHKPLLPVYRTIGANCVDAHVKVLKAVFDLGLNVSEHTTPQELAALVLMLARPPADDGTEGSGPGSGR